MGYDLDLDLLYRDKNLHVNLDLCTPSLSNLYLNLDLRNRAFRVYALTSISATSSLSRVNIRNTPR
ncbi:uncharacterized protein K441DRAFT_660370, partial [Cenococcum geophilum 1.58]|uniref:uncharacterized protein n=1 Tax=Cenococcum geophilum 1.58 TaxID=794803 RepID=UPI00358F1939